MCCWARCRALPRSSTRPGLINVDFADVRTVMSEKGMAMMGTGRAQGEGRAEVAAEAAISSPLLEDVNLCGAKGILVNITAGPDLTIGEFGQIGARVRQLASDSASVVAGAVSDPEMSGRYPGHHRGDRAWRCA